MNEQLAVSSGVALRKQGNLLHFFDLGTNAFAIAAFVFGVLAVITTGNGLLQIWLALTDQGELLLAGAGLATFGIAAGAAVIACLRAKAARERRPSSDLPLLATLDLDQQVLRDGTGQVLARLSDIHFEARYALGSRTRRLSVRWAGGERHLVNGTPFGGGLWAIQSELERRGFVVR